MTSANRNKDYRELLDELLVQGWGVETTTHGHTKATPPDPSQGIVHFSGSSDPHAYMNTVRDLRRRGFVWPPSSKNERNGARRMVETTKAEPAHLTLVVVEAPAAPRVIEPPEAPPPVKTVDQLFSELKEARTYDALAAEHLAMCRAKVEEATLALASADHEKRMAAEDLANRKAAFDKAFEATS